MRRIVTVAALALVLGLGFVLTYVYAATDVMSKSSYEASQTNELIGTRVENPLGEVVGTVQDFVIDSNGHVEFVIVSHDFYWQYVPRPSQNVVVPFSEMTVNPSKKTSVLKFSAWRLDFAPLFEKGEMGHHSRSESVYRYYGLKPYWAEGGHKGSHDPYRWGGEAQNF